VAPSFVLEPGARIRQGDKAPDPAAVAAGAERHAVDGTEVVIDAVDRRYEPEVIFRWRHGIDLLEEAERRLARRQARCRLTATSTTGYADSMPEAAEPEPDPAG